MDRRNFIKNTVFSGIGLCAATAAGWFYSDYKRHNIILDEDSNPYLEYFRYKIPLLDVHVVEHCNLNCKYCTHFANIAEPEFLDLKKFEKDITRLKEIADDAVEGFKLLGGEPLLHQKIEAFFPIIRKIFKDVPILLVTNGILLSSMPDKFWQYLSEYSVFLLHTIYPISYDMSFLKKIKQYGIKYTTRNVTEFSRSMISTKGKYDYLKQYKDCTNKVFCSAFADGKIYQCPFPAYVRHFNKKFGQNLKVSRFDYIDIYKAKSLEDLLLFFRKPTPFCRYCEFYDNKFKWESSEEHDISEYL